MITSKNISNTRTHLRQPPKENNCKDDFKQTCTWMMMMSVVEVLWNG